MNRWHLALSLCCVALLVRVLTAADQPAAASIPLPEHPRPDFQRPEWLNLNGTWQFQFDVDDQGVDKKWFDDPEVFSQWITVPFPWGSQLSGVEDGAEHRLVRPHDHRAGRLEGPMRVPGRGRE